jgi:hypoxanthine phosphoribosyltransferase
MPATRIHRLFSEAQIQARVGELALEISADYRGRELVLIGILKGAFVFLADLMRGMDISVKIDFIRAASYGLSQESQRQVHLTKDLELSIAGRDVLIVEDIVDTGHTLRYLKEDFKRRGARSVKSCVLLDKRQRREVEVDMEYVGFSMDEGFVVGYGLDWAEDYRNLPDLCVVEEGSANKSREERS